MIFCIILDRKWLIACILDEQCIKLPEQSSEEILSESKSESTAKPCNKGLRIIRRDTGCNGDDDGESKSGSGYVMCLSIISMLHDAYTNYL